MEMLEIDGWIDGLRVGESFVTEEWLAGLLVSHSESHSTPLTHSRSLSSCRNDVAPEAGNPCK